jgi:AcrR family transcriptional regulator
LTPVLYAGGVTLREDVASLTPQEESRRAREAAFRTRILAAAERLIGQRGLERTRMQDIAKDADVALATLYRYYPTKQEIYLAVVADRADAFFRRAKGVVDGAASAADNLMAFARAIADFCLEHADTLRFILRTTPSWGLGDHIGTWTAQRDFHAELVSRCMDEGVVVGRDADLVARQMVAITQVHLSDWLENGKQLDRDAVVAGICDQLQRSFFVTAPAALVGAR